MSWTPTERVREAAFDAWQNTSASMSVRDRLDAVLVAVGPHIAAQGIHEYVTAARENRSAYQWEPSEVFDDAEQWADQIEKEAGR